MQSVKLRNIIQTASTNLSIKLRNIIQTDASMNWRKAISHEQRCIEESGIFLNVQPNTQWTWINNKP